MTASLPAETLPVFQMGVYPTPLQSMFVRDANLPALKLLVKREDLCGVGFGGNKVRKLRLLVADALARGATVLLTCGGPQSNHCALTACAAALAGLKCELFFNAPNPHTDTGNQRIDRRMGATRTFLGAVTEPEVMAAMHARAAEWRQQGETPYLIPLGGSDVLGVLGYVQAIRELKEQLAGQPAPPFMVVTSGSLGTVAGLVLGTWVHGLDTHVDTFSVLWRQEKAQARLAALLEEVRAGFYPHVTPRANYTLSDAQLGGGYGVATAAGQEAAELAARQCGLMLEQTYTAKTFAGMLANWRAGRYRPGQRVLYWHTGGAGGYFA
ncbi:1-aminocyclopropane-1-carboxylate deaminase/D-cysteine desulfhydrase [Deinococcus fonticola]|uniref:1-aminocyclopropane-1-carboxylate deaminase/D-cysteine desulfhydrase n=1 Tax=Deinococcus fonticola TaxID=2528713 RepID=UPI00107569B2|nr:pyridoxal-phosphate dependent enzyme [Deinococcus fonticola]